MSSLERFSLSFFKENKISYRFDNGEIIFPCFFCLAEATMNASTTAWHCRSCAKNGTIRDLAESVKVNAHHEVRRIKVYQPKHERVQLTMELNRLIAENNGTPLANRLTRFKAKQLKLLDYLIERPIK